MSRIQLPGLLLLAALGAPALAGDDGAGDGTGLVFEPRLENNVALENDTVGAQFSFSGRAPNYPEGTALHVTLYVEGRSKAPVRAAFVKVLLEGGKFSGQFSWSKQKLSPMTYKADLLLYLDEQRVGVRRDLIQEFGWPAGHCEVLTTQDVVTGTAEERVSFPRQSLGELRKLVDGFEALRAEQLKLSKSDPPATEEVITDYTTRLGAHEQLFVEYSRAYVVRLESELVQRVQSTIATLSRCLRQLLKGQDPSARLIQCEQELNLVLVEIDSRLPLELDEDPDHKD